MIVLCVLASCMDAFLFGVSFGLNKIKITYKTALLTSLFPFLFSFLSMKIARHVGSSVDTSVSKSISISVYLLLALYFYHNHKGKEYSEGIWIDQNHDLVIKGKEIVLLALSLSLDTWIIALPLGFSEYSILSLASLFGFANYGLLMLGNYCSIWLFRYIPCRIISFSWVIFVILALLHS